MNLTIRSEVPQDYESVNTATKAAFLKAEHTDGNEHNLVARLRQSISFNPNLSLVAEINTQIVGHILFTPIQILSDSGIAHPSLALAPVSVSPEFQKIGIGAALIQEGHKIAKEQGYPSVILLGHPAYYPKFGYKPASQWGIHAPFEVPDEAFMALELIEGSLAKVSGTVKYPKEFL